MSKEAISQEQLVLQYQQLKALEAQLNEELMTLSALKADYEVAKKELDVLKEEKESLVPMGPVFVKSVIKPKVLVPLGFNIYIATTPEEAKKRLEEMEKNLDARIASVQTNLAKVRQALASIEAKFAELQRGASGAGQTQESPQKSGERSSQG